MKRTFFALVVVTMVLVGAQAAAQSVRINEIDPAGNWVELHNAGDAEVDVAGWQFCNRPAYAAIGDLEVVAGSTTIPAGGYLVVRWDAIHAGGPELGLYTSSQFGSADALVDYVEYGAAGGGRESVAVEAGLWEAGTFMDVPAEGSSLAYMGGGDTMLANWSEAAPTPGEENPAP